MKWLIRIINSSIGKKMIMALTGLGMCGFLISHLAGNLIIYGGKDAFNSYAEKLHSIGFLLHIIEVGLLIVALCHVGFGILLFLENLTARPTRYVKNKSGGGRTLGSKTMPYTGIITFVFIVIHLLNFHFIDKGDQSIFQIITQYFSSFLSVIFYMIAMIIVAIHVSHGFWSAFQSLGVNHPKYSPIIKILSICFSIIIGVGFGILPIYMFKFI